MQSKVQSLLESFANIFIGWVIGVLSSAIVFPLVGVEMPLEANLKASVFFTVISMVRSYAIRRYYNKKALKALETMNRSLKS